jgi:multiple sugar transport system permease protein
VSTAVAVRDTPRRRRRNYSTGLAFWAFVAPLLLGLLIFTFLPIVWGFLLSFSNARGTVALGNWAGIGNYANLLSDSAFRSSLLTIIIFTAFIVPTTYLIALGLALLVNRARRGRGFFRTVFFIPTAVSYVAASLVWKMEIFSGVFGLADQVLGVFHIPGPNWIAGTHPPLYWVVLVTVRLWLQLGFYMIVFLAGLQEIPQHLYEAAAVDGAKRGWATFRYITLPQLRNTSIAVLLLLFINAFMAFDEFYNIMGNGLTGAGNAILARPPLVYLYGVALGQQDYGRGAAGAFILSALILLVTIGQGRILGFGRSQS